MAIYGGRKDIMRNISPTGKVYQAGTLSGNPVAMAAGIAQLTILKNNPQILFRCMRRLSGIHDANSVHV